MKPLPPRILPAAALLLSLSLPLSSPAQAPSAAVILSYDGVSYGNLSTNSQALPPDCNGEPGPNHYVEFVNGAFVVHNKTTGKVIHFETDIDFWGNAGVGIDVGDGYSISDPRVIYDPASQRWFASQIDLNPQIDFDNFTEYLSTNDFLLAVSDTSDPSSTWSGVLFSSDPTGQYFADFPTLGVDSQGVYLAGDMFNAADDPTTATDVGCTLVSFSKADLLAGVFTNYTMFPVMSFSDRGQVYQPSTCADTSAVGKILAVGDLGNTSDPHSNLFTFAVQNITSGDAATLSPSTIITVAPYMVPDNAVAGVPLLTAEQPDGTSTLEGNDARFCGRARTLGGVIFGTHNTELNGRIAIQWYRINAGTGALIEQGTIADPNLDLFFPSIAANSAGMVVLTYQGSGPTNYIGCYVVVGQTVSNATSFAPPVLLKAGSVDYHGDDEAIYGLSRWGDYTTTTVDPVDAFRFWSIAMYPTDTDVWTTRISEIDATPQLALIASSGHTVTLSWQNIFSNYQLQSAPALPAAAASWTNVVQTPSTNGTQLIVQLPAGTNHQYFRLKKM